MFSSSSYMNELIRFSEELKKSHKPSGIIIAVSGPTACGKTTGAKTLSEAFGLKYYSVGNIFRSEADKMKIPIEDFVKIRSDEFDFEADKEVLKLMIEGNVVVEGRIVGILATFLKDIENREEVAIVRILYNPPLEIRANRYSQREGKPYEFSLSFIADRDVIDREKYARMYEIKDITDEKYYDIIIDNSNWSLEDAKVEPLKRVISYLKKVNRLHLLKVEPLLEYFKKIGIFTFE